MGIVFGVVFFRFGIWPTLISHYVYNTFLSAFPMVKSSSLYFQFSGLPVIGILLLPALVALFALASKRSS